MGLSPITQDQKMFDWIMSGARVPLLFVFILSLFIVGCRDYGGGGADEATYDQIQRLHRLFGEELLRARADLEALVEAAAARDDLIDLAAAYGEVVNYHEAAFADLQREFESLTQESSYRELKWVYGASIAERRAVHRRYQTLLDLARKDMATADTTSRFDRPYDLIPPYYSRILNTDRRYSINDLLAFTPGEAALSDTLDAALPDALDEASAGEASADNTGSSAQDTTNVASPIPSGTDTSQQEDRSEE